MNIKRKKTRELKNSLTNIREERLPGGGKDPEKVTSLRYRKRKGAILAYVVAILTFLTIVSAFLASSAVNNLKLIGMMAGKEAAQYIGRSAAEIVRGILMSSKTVTGDDTVTYLEQFKSAVVGFEYVSTAVPSFSNFPQGMGQDATHRLRVNPYFETLLENAGVKDEAKNLPPGYYGLIDFDDNTKKIKLWPLVKRQVSKEDFKKNDKIEAFQQKYYYQILTIRPDQSTSKEEIVGAYAYSVSLFAPKPVKDAADLHVNIIAFTGAHLSKSSEGVKKDFWDTHNELKKNIPYALYKYGNNGEGMSSDSLMKSKDALRNLDNLCIGESGGEKLRYSIIRCVIPLDAPDKFVTMIIK